MDKILQVVLLLIILLNSTYLMLGKNILSIKIFKLSWIIALIDVLLMFVFFDFKESMILYSMFTLIILMFSLGLRSIVIGNDSNKLDGNFLNNSKKKGFAKFFVYFLLLFLVLLSIGVLKNILFDSPI